MEDDTGWCHIHAQYIWHGDARIEGTRAALISIRDAIDKALNTGMDAEAEGLFAADGEGYHLKVSVRNYEYLTHQILPYTAHWACGIGAREAEAFYEEEIGRSEDLDEYYGLMNG